MAGRARAGRRGEDRGGPAAEPPGPARRGRLDRFVQTVLVKKGAATAKLARTVISGALGLAVRYGAIRTNPTRDIGRIASTPRRQPRSLTREERQEWIKRLHADPAAREKDLPDLCAFMLATGVRIGEALAVEWADVDLDGRLVVIEHTIVRVTGEGLRRKSAKSLAGERTLRLPGFAVSILRRRRLAVEGNSPVFPTLGAAGVTRRTRRGRCGRLAGQRTSRG